MAKTRASAGFGTLRRHGWAILALLATGCYGGVGEADESESGRASSDNEDPEDDDSVNADTDSAEEESDANASANASADSGDANDSDEPSSECADESVLLATNVPARRLTRFEYDNTVRDLLGDDSSPASALPSEILGNGFGNDANAQSVSTLLVEKYAAVAEDVAQRATQTPEAMTALFPCLGELSDGGSREDEDACATAFLRDFAPRAYRRPVTQDELDELFALQQTLHGSGGFRASIAGVVEAMLQSPDFLYRLEYGVEDGEGRLRPNGYEMASRLSYFLWGSMPDATLFEAAESGELLTNEGVRTHAERMLDDPRARTMVRFFFDNLLPISGLTTLQRDPERYPAYSPTLGALMREETQRLLDHVIFTGDGTWDEALTAPYTFANGPLAAFYELPGVEGDAFQQVPVDTSRRLGVLTHAGVLAGTIHSNETNPVVRGAFLLHKILCVDIPLPMGDILAQVKPPDPDSGATARERYFKHSDDPACRSCHRIMDPVGFSLENYDVIGRWRDTENGVSIDASGELPITGEATNGPIELIRAIARAPQTHTCFARQWANFAYGTTLKHSDCLLSRLAEKFEQAGHHIPTLLVELTQSDAFLYLSREGA